MAEYTPVSKVNYNLFKQNYDPNLPYNKQSETILQKYNEDLFNKYSGIANEEPKLGFFDKLGSGLENLFSAYGAEKPEVPNLSYQNITPTFNLGTGITNTTAASPFKIGIEDILNQYNIPGLRSQNLQDDLAQQIIAENQAKANPFVRPNMLDIAGGVVPGGITEITPSNMNLQKPNSLGFGTNYGVANTPDVIGDFLGSDVYQTDDGRAYYIDSKGEKILAPQKAEYYKQKQKPKSFRDSATLQEYFQNRNPLTGIMNLFRNLPTPMNILRGGIQSLKGFNDRLQGSMFGQSKNFAEYFQKRRDQKAAELAQQRGEIKSIQERLDKDPRGGGGGGFSPQGGGGFSTQGGPYGSGPGGIHG